MFTADNLIDHEKTLLHYAYKKTGDIELARDLVQTTYLRAIQYKDNYDSIKSLGAWLQTILMNVISSHYLAQSRRPQISDVTLEDLDMYAPLSTIDTYNYGYVFNNEKLDQAYQELKFAHKQIVYMTYVMDRSDKDISSRLNLPINTCRTRRKAALDNLREMVKDEDNCIHNPKLRPMQSDKESAFIRRHRL